MMPLGSQVPVLMLKYVVTGRHQRSRSQSPSVNGSPSHRAYPITSPTSRWLDRQQFKKVIQDNIVLISRALRHQFVIPEWLDFISHIEEFYWSVKGLTGGKTLDSSYVSHQHSHNKAIMTDSRWLRGTRQGDGGVESPTILKGRRYYHGHTHSSVLTLRRRSVGPLQLSAH
ncbi:uncharacterized protein LOC134774018 [Penaeus indicus]|uniref:uncharacterized protein LOC134774018 n=1 Tax=Penaeus indicus TaxID=29960 RepID=UPI00300C22B3